MNDDADVGSGECDEGGNRSDRGIFESFDLVDGQADGVIDRFSDFDHEFAGKAEVLGVHQRREGGRGVVWIGEVCLEQVACGQGEAVVGGTHPQNEGMSAFHHGNIDDGGEAVAFSMAQSDGTAESSDGVQGNIEADAASREQVNVGMGGHAGQK